MVSFKLLTLEPWSMSQSAPDARLRLSPRWAISLPPTIRCFECAVTEIRQFGANSTQVARRMRAMLEDLIPLVPPHRATILRQELDLLKSTTDLAFTVPQDRKLADLPDLQGLGGHRRTVWRK